MGTLWFIYADRMANETSKEFSESHKEKREYKECNGAEISFDENEIHEGEESQSLLRNSRKYINRNIEATSTEE